MAFASSVTQCGFKMLPRSLRPLLQNTSALSHQNHVFFGSPVCMLQIQNLSQKPDIAGIASEKTSVKVEAKPLATKQEPITQKTDATPTIKTPPKKVETAGLTGATEACKGHYAAKTDIDAAVQENLEQIRQQRFEGMSNPHELKHFRSSEAKREVLRQSPPTLDTFIDPTMVDLSKKKPAMGTDALPHPIWSEEEVHGVQITHKNPQGIIDNMAYYSVKLLRSGFDLVSGYNRKTRDEKLWLIRICFLETVAAVPGMVAAMTRHLHSLRRMRRDHGWIHTLLEEAENERMHLMTAMQLKQPSLMFRMAVLATQGVFVTFWSVAYMTCPRYCHRFVGYLEEEAVVTYTKCLADIENGAMQHWKTQSAPDVARRYWNLAPDATMKDVILAIRADEAHHRVVNHTFGSMKPDDYNPYKPGQ